MDWFLDVLERLLWNLISWSDLNETRIRRWKIKFRRPGVTWREPTLDVPFRIRLLDSNISPSFFPKAWLKYQAPSQHWSDPPASMILYTVKPPAWDTQNSPTIDGAPGSAPRRSPGPVKKGGQRSVRKLKRWVQSWVSETVKGGKPSQFIYFKQVQSRHYSYIHEVSCVKRWNMLKLIRFTTLPLNKRGLASNREPCGRGLKQHVHDIRLIAFQDCFGYRNSVSPATHLQYLQIQVS